jgi:hypothetical protein
MVIGTSGWWSPTAGVSAIPSTTLNPASTNPTVL